MRNNLTEKGFSVRYCYGYQVNFLNALKKGSLEEACSILERIPSRVTN